MPKMEEHNIVVEPLEPQLQALLNILAERGINNFMSGQDDLVKHAREVQRDLGIPIVMENLQALIYWAHMLGMYLALWLGAVSTEIALREECQNAASNPADAGKCDPEAVPGLSPDSGVGGVENEQRNDETPWG